jgi:PIN domain nuclease of toxin-antitoxin system
VSEIVLDASALIAFFKSEPGGASVLAAMPGAVISSVNLTEVVTRLIDDGFSSEYARKAIADTPIEIVSFDEGLAFAAGVLRASTRAHGLSLGDRACLALARRLSLPVLTGDRNWTKVDVGVEVKLIRA